MKFFQKGRTKNESVITHAYRDNLEVQLSCFIYLLHNLYMSKIKEFMSITTKKKYFYIYNMFKNSYAVLDLDIILFLFLASFPEKAVHSCFMGCPSFKFLHYLIFTLIIQVFYYELVVLELSNRRIVLGSLVKGQVFKCFKFYFLHMHADICEIHFLLAS